MNWPSVMGEFDAELPVSYPRSCDRSARTIVFHIARPSFRLKAMTRYWFVRVTGTLSWTPSAESNTGLDFERSSSCPLVRAALEMIVGGKDPQPYL